MSTLLTDIRYALRMLLKAPGFTVIAVVALALGIGANTAIFSVVNAVLLRPLPYPEPDKLILLREKTPVFPGGSVSYPNYLDWREAQRTLTDLVLLRRVDVNFAMLSGDTAPERFGGAQVSYNFLAVLGLKPRLGRDFTEADDVPNGPKVALISDKLWQRRFGGSATVLGQQVVLNGVPREIIGVLPPDLQYPRRAEIYVPLGDVRGQENVLARGNHPGFSALGRLKPGVTIEQADADLNTIAAALEQKYPDTNTGRRIDARRLLDAAVGDYRHSLNLPAWLRLVRIADRVRECREPAARARRFAEQGTRSSRRARSWPLAPRTTASHGKHAARAGRRRVRNHARGLECRCDQGAQPS
jgi:putative ABC transport system permease protein